jgi:hypothetical protein
MFVVFSLSVTLVILSVIRIFLFHYCCLLVIHTLSVCCYWLPVSHSLLSRLLQRSSFPFFHGCCCFSLTYFLPLLLFSWQSLIPTLFPSAVFTHFFFCLLLSSFCRLFNFPLSFLHAAFSCPSLTSLIVFAFIFPSLTRSGSCHFSALVL